jgi:membrane protease YdiL (CAAX protease family)
MGYSCSSAFSDAHQKSQRFSIVESKTQRRNLPIVRLLVFALSLAATAVVATIVTRLLVPAAPSPLHDWVLLKNALLPILLLAVYAKLVRVLENRQASEISLERGVILLPAGLTVGVAAISCYVIGLVMAGAAEISGGSASADLVRLGNEFLVPWLTAVGEELIFRAVLFRMAEEMFGSAVAVAISSTLFALAHAANPGATAVTLVALAIGLGALLALSYAATRNLWFPIGLHMGWNLAVGFLYGLPNSGQLHPTRLANTSVHGGDALTGGDFGPEASAILVTLCLLMSAMLLAKALRERRWVSARAQVDR